MPDVTDKAPESTPDYGAMVLPVEEKPAWLSDEYFDREAGAIRLGAMQKRVNDARGELKKLQSRRVPEGGYVFKAPDDIGMEVVPDNPLFKVLGGWATERNLAQEDVDTLVSGVMTELAAAYSMAPEEASRALQEVYGPRAKAVMQGNAEFVERFKDDSGIHGALQMMLMQPAGQRALKAIRDHYGDLATAKQGNAASAPQRLTRKDLERMHQDPRYDEDPEFRAEVSRGWRQLLGEEE